METTSASRTVNNVRKFVMCKKPDIWVPRDQREAAEIELQRLQNKGTITSFSERPEWGCNGSINYLVEYPA